MGDADALGLIGTTIAEKYAVEAVVGEGGFATVYRAQHLLWKRPVAVKVFKALGDVAPSERARLLEEFIQEGRLLAELSERSTAIVQARDVGMLATAGGGQIPYMVLEWLDGRPLEAVLHAERRAGMPLRTLEQTIKFLEPAAEALAIAHRQGIAHRDVKPANIFIVGDPRGEHTMKLLDFGIAKVVQDAQKMGFAKTAGIITSFTPSYGAPEQFNRAYGATGPWTDVFALGLVLVELLVGREALAGDSLVQLAYAAADPVGRPTPRRFGVPTSDETEAVFQKALAVSPAERYQTVGDLWSALRSVTIGQLATIMQTGPRTNPSPTMPTLPLPGPVRESSKAGAAFVVAALTAVAFAGGGLLAMRHYMRPKPAPVAASASRPAAVVGAPACPAGMKPIPGGEFFMGADQLDAEANEKPPHKVKLAPYCLDEREVTVAKYKACSDRGACLRAGRENVWPGITRQQKKTYDPLCNANETEDRLEHPVNCVDWDQARLYCEAQAGRLPTEAEWEFAARGSDGRIYPWGDKAPDATLLNACGSECVAWMKAHPDPDATPAAMYDQNDGFVSTAPVGSFPKGASQYGILDIAGNVWEWVGDWFAAYDPASASTMTMAPRGPATGDMRVIRGGAWNGAMPAWVRPSWRYSAPPGYRTHGIGFRCARTL